MIHPTTTITFAEQHIQGLHTQAQTFRLARAARLTNRSTARTARAGVTLRTQSDQNGRDRS